MDEQLLSLFQQLTEEEKEEVIEMLKSLLSEQ